MIDGRSGGKIAVICDRVSDECDIGGVLAPADLLAHLEPMRPKMALVTSFLVA